MRRLVITLTILLAPLASASGQTLTARDIVELSKAGIGQEVLLALIDVHRPVFPIDTDTLKGLKDSGVPRDVIIAMVKSGRQLPPAPVPVPAEPLPPPPPQVVIVEHEHYQPPAIREVAVPVPVYVPVHVRHDRRRAAPKPVEPVYWGFGGKLRPDAWKPTAADVQKDARVPREPQKK